MRPLLLIARNFFDRKPKALEPDRRALRAKSGIDSPTEITPRDAEEMARALRQKAW